MYRDIFRVEKDKKVIEIPEEYVNKEIEVVIFETKEGMKREKLEEKTEKNELDEIFLEAREHKVKKNIEIEKISKEINNDIF